MGKPYVNFDVADALLQAFCEIKKTPTKTMVGGTWWFEVAQKHGQEETEYALSFLKRCGFEFQLK